MAIENVLIRDDHGFPHMLPLLLKTATEDADGFALGVCPALDDGTYNVFYGDKSSRAVSEDILDFPSWAACFTFEEGDKQVLAMQLRELADLLETMK